MADYSNLTRLGILPYDPGSVIYGRPSPNAYQPLPYPPLEEPLQKPDFSLIPFLPMPDTFVKPSENNNEVNPNENNTVVTPDKIQPNEDDNAVKPNEDNNEEKPLQPEEKQRNFNWKKFVGITSIVLLAIFGLPKLIKNAPELLKKIPDALKNTFNKIPELFKKIPDALKKIPELLKKIPDLFKKKV